jgi:signal transduction histidine kinase
LFGFKKKNNTALNEQGLFQENALSETALNNLIVGVFMLDKTGSIILSNFAGNQMIGYEPKDTKNKNYIDLIKITDSKGAPIEASINPIARNLIEGGKITTDNYFLSSRNNVLRPIGLVIKEILDTANQSKGTIVILRDLTREKLLDQQRSDFISTASHEMRTPVAAIEGYLALALNEKVTNIDEKARNYLEKAHASAERLGKLFQDLLNSARAEDGRLQNNPEVINVAEFLESLSSNMKFMAEKKGLNFEFLINANQDKSKEQYLVNVDKDRLGEVINNLYENANKYTESGKIVIGLTGNPKVVQLRVQDTGDGIPADAIPHLFEKFYRADNSSTREIGGTGLGLYLAKEIVKLYDGRIWVESEVGKGSTFYINLPRINRS